MYTWAFTSPGMNFLRGTLIVKFPVSSSFCSRVFCLVTRVLAILFTVNALVRSTILGLLSSRSGFKKSGDVLSWGGLVIWKIGFPVINCRNLDDVIDGLASFISSGIFREFPDPGLACPRPSPVGSEGRSERMSPGHPQSRFPKSPAKKLNS